MPFSNYHTYVIIKTPFFAPSLVFRYFQRYAYEKIAVNNWNEIKINESFLCFFFLHIFFFHFRVVSLNIRIRIRFPFLLLFHFHFSTAKWFICMPTKYYVDPLKKYCTEVPYTILYINSVKQMDTLIMHVIFRVNQYNQGQTINSPREWGIATLCSVHNIVR